MKKIAEYFMQRFIGKFVDQSRPLDLSTASFDADEVVIRDISLNCKVSCAWNVYLNIAFEWVPWGQNPTKIDKIRNWWDQT